MSKVHPKQHFMPQFLQRNFSDNKKTVYSFIHNHGIIKQVNISSHMQNRNDFDEKTEKLLSRLESNASIEIQKMIDDPINYQHQNPTLPDSVIQFLISMNNRSPDTFNKYKKYVAILRTIMQSKIESEPDKQWFEFYDEILFSNCDTPEHHSALVNSTDIDPKMVSEWYLGNYQLVKTTINLFLPESIVIGYLPISSNILLIYESAVIDWDDLPQVNQSLFLNMLNSYALSTSKNNTIVSSTTTKEYIDLLYHQKNVTKQLLYAIAYNKAFHKYLNDVVYKQYSCGNRLQDFFRFLKHLPPEHTRIKPTTM